MSFNSSEYIKLLNFIDNFTSNAILKPKIVAISKNHPISAIEEALEHGLRTFGENRVQEAEKKFYSLKEKYQDIELHLTGPLQSNKIKAAIKIFDIFQTLDREKIANEFFKNLEPSNNKKFFIQVNLNQEEQKSGTPPNMCEEFFKYCSYDLKLKIIGLMCIPPQDEDPSNNFLKLKDLALKCNLKYLSMGMSADFKQAIKCGATHIRIGTLLFGKR